MQPTARKLKMQRSIIINDVLLYIKTFLTLTTFYQRKHFKNQL